MSGAASAVISACSFTACSARNEGAAVYLSGAGLQGTGVTKSASLDCSSRSGTWAFRDLPRHSALEFAGGNVTKSSSLDSGSTLVVAGAGQMRRQSCMIGSNVGPNCVPFDGKLRASINCFFVGSNDCLGLSVFEGLFYVTGVFIISISVFQGNRGAHFVGVPHTGPWGLTFVKCYFDGGTLFAAWPGALATQDCVLDADRFAG
jgi:hypothetical protein